MAKRNLRYWLKWLAGLALACLAWVGLWAIWFFWSASIGWKLTLGLILTVVIWAGRELALFMLGVGEYEREEEENGKGKTHHRDGR